MRKDDGLMPWTQAKLIQDEIEKNHRSGWFYLQRNKLTRESRREEQRAIADNHNNPQGILSSGKKLETRSNKRYRMMDGVTDECFYSLSYLSKVYSNIRTGELKNHRLFASSNLDTMDKRAGRQ